jgi:hypothetical protein
VNYSSRTKVESKLKDEKGELLYPGVVFVINRMNERRRLTRELQLADLRMKVNEQSEALRNALKEKDSLAPGQLDHMNAEFGNLLHGEWYPAWIRWGVVAIEGFEIDGVAASIKTLCEDGPTDLVEEAFYAVIAAAGLSTPETKNSESPGTSEGQADGKTNDSTAPSAEKSVGGESAIAPSISPAT